MSSFRVTLTPEAQQDLKRLDPALQTRILNKLEWMGENARLLRHQALQGREWAGCSKTCGNLAKASPRALCRTVALCRVDAMISAWQNRSWQSDSN